MADIQKIPSSSVELVRSPTLFNHGKKRPFTFWTALAITICVAVPWEGVGVSILQVFATSGPSGLLYGFILCSVCMLSVTASLAELASIWPTSGAEYHWAAYLSPPKYRNFISWVAGWVTLSYTILAPLSCAVGIALQIQGYAIMRNPEYEPLRWHAYLIVLILVCVWILINIWGNKLLRYTNFLGLGLHAVGFVVTAVVILACSPTKHPAEFVFNNFTDKSGWNSLAASFSVGILSPLSAFGGIAIVAHFSEEVQDAPIAVPRAMFWSVICTIVTVFPWILSLLFSIGDIDALLASPAAPLAPLAQLYATVTNSTIAGIFISNFVTYLAFTAGCDGVGGAARTIMAMSRDNCFPLIIAEIHPTLNVPVWSILASAVPILLLGLIYIGNSTAFFGILSGAITLYIFACAIPIGLHLFYGRSKMNIEYGPWNMGKFGVAVNIVAFISCFYFAIILCLPVYMPVQAVTMNYSSAIVVGALVISAIAYLAYGRGRYSGPTFEIVAESPVESKVDIV